MAKKRRRTLLEDLAELQSTAPAAFADPEVSDFDGTSALLVGKNEDEDDEPRGDGADIGIARPGLRMAAAMDSLGEAYSGRRISRRELLAQDDNVEQEGADSEEGSFANEEVRGADELRRMEPLSISLDDGFGGVYTDEEDSSDAVKDDAEQSNVFTGLRAAAAANGGDLEAQIAELEREDAAVRGRRATLHKDELRKAEEVLRQKRWYDSFLELRILLQRLVNSANRLPLPSALKTLRESDSALDDYFVAAADGLTRVAGDLCKLRAAQALRCGVSDVSGGSRKRPRATGGAVAGDFEALEGLAAEQHAMCRTWWAATADRWQEKTQLHSASLQKSFKVVNQGIMSQVDAVLADEERAQRKIYMRAAAVQRLGATKETKKDLAEANAPEAAKEPPSGASGGLYDDDFPEDDGLSGARRRQLATAELDMELDMEALDDSDFYQQLLKEFVSASSGSGAVMPVRAKKTKKSGVDTRASKGRKLRYAAHPKLEAFMYPVEYPTAPVDADQLFASLFGRAAARK